MSVIRNAKSCGMSFHIESYESAWEVVENCKTRKITDSSFKDMANNFFIAARLKLNSYGSIRF